MYCGHHVRAEEPTLKDHIRTIVSLTDPEYRDRVADFPSESPTRATGRTVDASLAKNEINRIDRRQEYVARFSALEVFRQLALNVAREPGDRVYAIHLLGRLASLDATIAKQVIATLRTVSREDDDRAKHAAEIVLQKLNNLTPPTSPRDVVLELNEALRNGDSETALSLFHQVGDYARIEQAIPRIKSFGEILDSERILDLAIVVVGKGRDVDPICLMKIGDHWKICTTVTEFTLPVSSHREARSIVAAMDALQAWYDERHQQLSAVDQESR